MVDGPVLFHDEKGNLIQECYFINNLLERKLIIYENNKIYIEINYFQGKKHGKQYIYGDNNQLLEKALYRHGILIRKIQYPPKPA